MSMPWDSVTSLLVVTSVPLHMRLDSSYRLEPPDSDRAYFPAGTLTLVTASLPVTPETTVAGEPPLAISVQSVADAVPPACNFLTSVRRVQVTVLVTLNVFKPIASVCWPVGVWALLVHCA